MRAHVLQHVAFEGVGSIGTWLDRRGYEVTYTRFFQGDDLPNPKVVDFLVVMGGPMSVHDEALFPWLADEKAFIRECIEQGKRVLGVCLGAQLMAAAMGARVYPNKVKEIGWWPVQGTEVVGDSLFHFPPVFEAFHWHGDAFELPRGAIQLARTEGCENQAFQLGRRAIGLQFHLEVTPAAVREMVANGREELQPAAYVQGEEAILSAPAERYRRLNELMADLLSFLTGTES